MSKSKNVGKRVLAIILSLTLMLTTFVTFNIGTLVSSAKDAAISITDNPQENVYFYVPEQIYLAPDIDSYATQDRYGFQWFIDSKIDKNTHLATPNVAEQTSGNFYFYYEKATSITVTFKYLNQDLSEMTAYTNTSSSTTANFANQNSTIRLASNSVDMSALNTRTDVARTRYTVGSNTIDTTITRDGLSPYLSSGSSGYYIEWTVEYVDGNDGITKAVRAYTYVFKPFVQPVGSAIRVENNQGGDTSDHFAQNISWVSGVHGLVTTGSYYPNASTGDRGLVTFSSRNPVGKQLGAVSSDLYAQFAGASFATDGYFGYSPDNTGSIDYLSTSANYAFTQPSFNYINKSAGVIGANDRSVYAFQTAPTSKLMVDSSRYSNLNQIPNLSIGMMVTDDESSDGDGAWYIADMGTKTDSSFSDSGDQRNATSNGEAYWNNYDYIIANVGTYSSTVSGAEIDGVKYNGTWNRAISSTSTSGTFRVRTAYFNHDGSGDHYGGDTSWDVAAIPVDITFNNKQALRDAYEKATNAAAYFGLKLDGTTVYYNSNAAVWQNYVNLYLAAGQLLANLDTMSSITVGGTTYNCDQLASALNDAIANMQSARNSSVAFARFLALEKDAFGNYILKTMKDTSTNANAADESHSYKYGNTVTHTAPAFPGYTYVGYADGLNYSDGASLGADYAAALTGTAATLSNPYTSIQNISYTFFYIPTEISSIVDTKDGIYNFIKTATSDYPVGVNAGYPSHTAVSGDINDFNYKVAGNDVIAWTMDNNTREQFAFLPLCVDLEVNTTYIVTYDVTGTDASNVQLSFVNSTLTGGNGNSTSEYAVSASGGTFTTNSVDAARAFVKLELLGDARDGKEIRVSNICVARADTNELYLDTTNGYAATYTPTTSDPKTNMGYTTSGVNKVVVTTRYNTMTYDQYQLLPYYVELKPNCSYEFDFGLSGIDASKVKLSFYNPSFTGGNGSTLNYYEFDGSGSVITVGPNDDGIAQLRIDILNSAAGVSATLTNLDIENLDTKTTISGTYNQKATLGIPVKEGYTLKGWNLKSNSGGSAHGTVAPTGNDRIYEYTFGSDIDIIEAVWEPATLKVIFRGEDGEVISEQGVIYGNAATTPTEQPEKFGHTFAGWDTDYTTVTKNLIIEPVYEQKDIEVTVTPASSEIFAGSTTQLTATFEPNEPEISTVEWKSNKTNIATVDANGVVTGVAEGTATITATITYDGRTYSSTATVKVNPVKVTGIAINTAPDKTQYFTGEEFDPTGLTLTVTYNNGTTAVVSEGYTLNSVNTTYAGTKTVRVTYQGFTATTRITVTELKITEIVVVTPPDKTEYFVGDEDFDTTGLVVVAKYNNGDEEELAEGDYELDGFDTSEAGTVEIVVFYEDFEATFEITVKTPELTGIAVKKMPTKTTYFVGESANYAGLVLEATYSNGYTEEITEGYTVTGFDSQTAGQKTITAEYEGKTTTFNLTVKAVELESIEIVTPAKKTEYFTGDTADYTGLTIKANYNNGTSEMVDSYNVTGFDSQTAGQKTITVEYEGKTVTFTVTVKAIEIVKLEVATNPNKTEYNVNETIDTTGLTLKATYNNGTTATIENGYAIGNVDMSVAGDKTVEVTYEGKTTSFAITVKAIYVTGIEIETMPNKTEYVVGEAEDNTGLTIKVTYNDGSTAVVSEGFEVIGFDSTAKGTVTILVSYEGYIATYDITVIGLADWSKVDELLNNFKAEDPTIYKNYDEVYYGYVYTFEETLVFAKDVYTTEKDQGEVDKLYDELQGYYDMLELKEKADWSEVDALVEEINGLDAELYENYDEIYWTYLYSYINDEIPAAKEEYIYSDDQEKIDDMYDLLLAYKDMLVLKQKADWSRVDALIAEINGLNPEDYENYDEIYWTYLYSYLNDTIPAAKEQYVYSKDQAQVDAIYNQLLAYKDMLVLKQTEPEYVERFEPKGTTVFKTQAGVKYIWGLQPRLLKAGFQNNFVEYENVTLEYKMTTARYLGTGSTVTVKSAKTGEVIDTYVIVIYGDLDGNAVIDTADSTLLFKSLTGVASLTAVQRIAANVEGTRASITTTDKTYLDQAIAGKRTINQVTGKAVLA